MGKFDGLLLASDFDDTLYSLDLHIPQRNLEAIRYFTREGGYFVISTGRAHRTFAPYAPLIPMNAPAVLSNGSALYDFEEGRMIYQTFLRAQAPADLAELAAKYNPRRMTQAEYDSFLENLVDKGILSKGDLDHLGYRGMVVLGPESEGAYSWGVTSRWDVSGMSLSQLRGFTGAASLADAGGDALTMASLLACQKPCAATSPEALAFAQESADAYRALAEALEAVQARRGG